ncbi:MAG: carboxypeptidase-like regulatory domain-containing protein [Acidobacteriota bacterium]
MSRWFLVFVNLLAGTAWGQTITGSIVGSVKDPSNLAVANAEVTLTHAGTAAERRAATNERGDFVFSSLQPGEYNITVKLAGFKTAEQRSVTLTASQVLPVGDIVLEVGAVTESVTVSAQAAVVQTASSERAGVVTSSQVDGLLIRGRNVMSLLQLLPGVVDLQVTEQISRNWNLRVLGNRANTSNLTLDGMALTAIGNQQSTMLTVSQDAIAEVKILISNYQAEYGRMSGANILLVSKSGTREFHGLGSYFKRHEQFNANNFFSNRTIVAGRSVPKPRYRFNTWNYNVGGPVYVPKRFNRNRDKLFFFWSQEYWPSKIPQPVGQLTVPTELERAGDFSQSLDLNGRLIPVTDPSNGQPFAGNRIPAGRIDRNGQALLKFLPAANFFDRNVSAGRYNYVFQTETDNPQRMETLKLDYNLSSSNLFSFNFSMQTLIETGYQGISTTMAPWPEMVKTFDLRSKVWVLRYQRILSPTLINEFSAGFAYRPSLDIFTADQLRRMQRDTIGFAVGQFNPEGNPWNIVPNATFGGVQNPANINSENRFPFVAIDSISTITDNVTKTTGSHTVKAGIYADLFLTNRRGNGTYNGAFDFGRNVNNPLETGYAYSNAILGVFNSYSETSWRPYYHAIMQNIEWFIQDNWKVNRRLTLDYGLRSCWIPPTYERDNIMSGFAPDRFDPSRQVKLIAPAMVGGRKVGVHPVTGAVYPVPAIGAFAPGVGDIANGMVWTAKNSDYPRALIQDRGIHYAPRFGFAYDPFGKGTTSIRAGLGMFYNRLHADGVTIPFTGQPPIVQTPVVYFGTLPALLSSSSLLFPQNVLGIDRGGKVPSTVNMSFGVQQRVPFGTVLDLAYVGSLGRHLLWSRNLNAIPFGANFDRRNADPTNPNVPLSPSFLRPYLGHNNIDYREWAASSNYHSLQVTANRRFASGLQFGAAWTWSKTMDFNDGDTDSVSTLVPVRVWNYGLASFDRTHVLNVNWLWDVPKSPWKALPARVILDDWTVSGIASFVSGAPLGVGFSQVVATDITGSPTDGARIVVTGNPVLPKSERTFSRNFRTEVFQAPAVGAIGNAAKTLIRGPGINNWDIAIFKNLPVHERMRFQFRWEMYNAFNHTQFSGVDTAARFDAQGRQVNARFGEFTAARNPRQMQLALRFYY